MGNIAVFLNEKLKKAFKEELLSWIGTPWKNATCLKGIGVDCANFVQYIYCYFGFLTKLNENKFYSPKWLFGRRELLYESLLNALHNSLHEDIIYGYVDDFMTGDVICFSLHNKKRVEHLGIVFDGETFIHAHPRKGVVRDKILLYKNKIKMVIRAYWKE